MASLSLFLVGFLVWACGVRSETESVLEMDNSELLALFDVFEALVDDPAWASDHPQPCSDTPWPGLQCEIGQEEATPLLHVTKLHIGPDILDPPCKLSATLSHSLLKLPYLKTLSIFSCFVASPSRAISLSPSLFGSLSSLEHLALVSNPSLSGEIPPSLSKLTCLRVLSLSQNGLQGEIPSELGGISTLEQLDLSYNNLSGEIPEEIGGIENLTILDLSWNSIEGRVPSSLGQSQLLQKVDFGSNKLAGLLPSELGKLKKLVLLDLSTNLLNGPIPESLSGLDNLQYFIADHNPLNSEVPQFVGELKKLQTLSLKDCGLRGAIPHALTSLTHLSSLSLDQNNLTGEIPRGFGLIPSLDLLNLSHNELSGEVSLEPGFVDRLGKRLDIRGNDGLCTRDRLYERNISSYLEVDVCSNSTGGDDGERRNDKGFGWRNPSDDESDDQGMKPSDDDQSRLKEVSDVPWLKKPSLVSCCFALFVCLLSLSLSL